MRVLILTFAVLTLSLQLLAQVPTRSRSSSSSSSRASAPAPAPSSSSSGGTTYSSGSTSYSGYRAGYGGYGGFRGGGGGSTFYSPLPTTTRVRVPGGYRGPVLVQERCYGRVRDIAYVAANMSFIYPRTWFGQSSLGCSLRFQTLGCSPFDLPIVRRRGDVIVKGVRLTPHEGYETTAVSVTTYTAPKEALKALQKGRKALFGVNRNLIAAQEWLEEAVRLHPEFAEAWTLLGLTRMTRRNYTGAITALEKSLDIDPAYGAPYSPLAKSLIAESSYARAVEVAEAGVALNPGDVDLKYNLVVAAFAMKDNETAQRWSEQLYEIGEADYYPAILYVLALASDEAEQPERAARFYQEYLDRPGRPRLRELSHEGLKKALLASAVVEARAATVEASPESIGPVEIVSPSKQ